MSTLPFSPPNVPWREIKHQKDAGGSMSFYYSDALSKLPIREVTRVGDNKADPNLETLTYGMFSTCQKGLRSAFVRDGRRFLFFVSRREGKRVLLGYYDVKWFAQVVNSTATDYALAAQDAFFTATPLSLEEIDQKYKTELNTRFRLNRKVTEGDCAKLLQYFQSQENSIGRYIEEIHRLEYFNQAQGGYKYIGRKQEESFSWELAKPYIISATEKVVESPNRPKNSSPSDWWRCEKCGGTSKNKALLRVCPNCGEINSLQPMDLPPSQAK